MSRYELAKRIDVTYPTITAIYNGDSTSIKLDILEALCRELDCTPNEIVIPENESVEYNIEYEKASLELLKDILDAVGGTKGMITSVSPISITLDKEKKAAFIEAMNNYTKRCEIANKSRE